MPKRPRSNAFETLTRILAQRSHARVELVRKLRQRSYKTEEIEEALHRAQDLGFLESDEDIAQRYAEELAKKRHATPRWVHHKLRSRGLPEPETARAVTQAFEGWDARQAAQNAVQGETNAVRVAQRLQRWGFDAETVRAVVKDLKASLRSSAE